MPTGPGSVDAQGVYLYGQDDAEALASDLLNIGQASISTQFGLDRTRLTKLEATSRGRQTFAAVTAGAGGLADLGTAVTFAAVAYASVIELEVLGVVDLSASPPSGRTVILNFATTAGTLTEDVVTTIDWATSAPTAGSQRLISQRASIALPASTAADVKLRWNPSANAVRIGASAWRWTRSPA